MARLLSRLGAGALPPTGVAVVLVWLAVLVGGAVGAVTLAGETSNTVRHPRPGVDDRPGAHLRGVRRRAAAPARRSSSAPPTARRSTDARDRPRPSGSSVGELARPARAWRGQRPVRPGRPDGQPDLTTGLQHRHATPRAVGEVTPEQQDALLERRRRRPRHRADRRGHRRGRRPSRRTSAGRPRRSASCSRSSCSPLTYGSLVTAGMNLLTAAVGVGIGILGITITTGFAELSSTTPDAGRDARPRGRHRLRAVHRQPPPAGAAAPARTCPTAVATAVGHGRLGRARRRAHRRHRARRAVRRRHPVPDPDGRRRRRDRRRRRPRRADPGAGRARPSSAAASCPGGSATGRRRPPPTTPHRPRPARPLGRDGDRRARAVACWPPSSRSASSRSRSPRCRPRWCRRRRRARTQARAEQLLADGFGAGVERPADRAVRGRRRGRDGGTASAPPARRRSTTSCSSPTPVPSPDGSAALLSVVPESGPSEPGDRAARRRPARRARRTWTASRPRSPARPR